MGVLKLLKKSLILTVITVSVPLYVSFAGQSAGAIGDANGGVQNTTILASSISIGLIVPDHGQGSGQPQIEIKKSPKTSDQGAVAGLMSLMSPSVDQYKSIDNGLKVFILAFSVLLLVATIKLVLFSLRDINGNKYVWFNRRPIISASILTLFFVLASVNLIGISL